MKFRDAASVMKAQGAKPVRTRGSHQVWETREGRHVNIIVNHMNDDVLPYMVKQLRKAGIKL